MIGFVSILNLPCLCLSPLSGPSVCHLCSLNVLDSRLCSTFHFSCNVIAWAMSLFNFTSYKATLTGFFTCYFVSITLYCSTLSAISPPPIHSCKWASWFCLILFPQYHLTRTTLCFILIASVLVSFSLGLLRTQDNITVAYLIPESFSQDWG